MSESGSRPETEGLPDPEQSAPSPAPTTGVEPGVEPASTSTTGAKDPLRGSRASGVWVAVVALVVILVLLSIFVLQNTQPVEVTFLGWEGEAPLAATLLIAVAAGLLIAVIAGSLRILQLRRRVRREQKR
jgi:uncharacterized integral membrane protein